MLHTAPPSPAPPYPHPPFIALHELQVIAVKGDMAKIALTQPVCTQADEKIALSRRVEKHWR